MADPKEVPQKEVNDFHKNADTDGSRNSVHHTLGAQKEQGAPGNHDHRGGDSTLLFAGNTIIGTRGAATAINSIIALLVELGATDATTP